MEKTFSRFFALMVGLIFMFLPLERQLFEGLTSVLSALFHIIGFVIVVIFGCLVIYDSFKKFGLK